MADEKVKAVNLKDRAYVPQPISFSTKRDINKLGFSVVDAQFAPKDYKIPASVQAVLDKAGVQANQPALQPVKAAAATKAQKPATPPAAPALTPAPSTDNTDALYGSSTLQSVYVIGGKEVQLGDIVRAAHAKSELSVEAWNELPEADRDGLLTTQLEAMQAEALKQEQNPPAKPVSEMTDQELRDAITAAGGVKPAWNAKRENLETAYAAATIPK